MTEWNPKSMHCWARKKCVIDVVEGNKKRIQSHINQIAQVLHEVFVNCCVGGFQAELIFVLRLQRLQPSICVLVFSL